MDSDSAGVQRPEAGGLRIGQLAAELGMNPKTIRYYEEIGLLPRPRRTPAGYRLYGAADRDRLGFIAKAKAVGLTLGQIGEIMALRGSGECPCGHVLDLLDRKVAAIDEQLRVLADLRDELVVIKHAAAGRKAKDATICGIIEHFQPPHRADPAAMMGSSLRRSVSDH